MKIPQESEWSVDLESGTNKSTQKYFAIQNEYSIGTTASDSVRFLRYLTPTFDSDICGRPEKGTTRYFAWGPLLKGLVVGIFSGVAILVVVLAVWLTRHSATTTGISCSMIVPSHYFLLMFLRSSAQHF